MGRRRKLTAPEQAVLDVLTEGIKTSGVVRLASDLYQRGHDRRFTFGDPIGFVAWLLEGLAEQGLVRFKVGTGYNDLPYDIRLTPEGWAHCGYAHKHSEVGLTPYLREVAPGDRTDYRTHGDKAEHSPVETLTNHMHWAKYPDHPHPVEWWGEGVEVMPRDYMRVTPSIEERVVQSYIRTGDYAKTAAEANVTERQVRYIVRDRPALARDTGSLKIRVLTAIRDNGPYPDIMGLHRDVPGPHGLHNLVHVLHSLHKAELIDFKEDKANGRGVNYLNIRATLATADADFSALDEPDDLPDFVAERIPEQLLPEVAHEEAEVAQKEREVAQKDIAEEAPTVAPTVGPTYPELARIREDAARLAAEEIQAHQYLAAAELLTNTDAETAELLLNKAAAIGTTRLNPVEAEYLAYAQENERGTNPDR